MDVLNNSSDEEILELIWEEIRECGKMYSLEQRERLSKSVFHSLRKLDVLQELVEDKDITEIMVNGHEHIFYEKSGRIYEWEGRFSSKEKLEDIIQQIVAGNNRMVNESNPIVDTRLSDGSRVNIVLSPIALDGSVISIRKFPDEPMRMEQLIRYQSISKEVVDFLELLVKSGYNIFISGGTGSGKTTFLNALSEFIPKETRVITIEDSAELKITGIPNLVRFETRNANVQGENAVTMRDLIRTALRARPDIIIVGECRGAEALDMLQAMNTGHDGSLSTGHANSCVDMISRLETMVLMGMELPLSAIRGQIASGIDILIHLGRMRDRSRKVLEIAEIDGMKDGEVSLHTLFQFKETGETDGKIEGIWEKTGELKHTQKLKAAGLWKE
ncbi:MAG: CpaF family protein [Lachnospiraceae bacterium]|nr:CpaF family protein [Lachnospiraceae bacterium]MDD6169055.1 CpaF family protein [Lachnospiraceae bacterium]MDY4839520.1 CpaF family protein [Lachnospiraceae bacterium]